MKSEIEIRKVIHDIDKILEKMEISLTEEIVTEIPYAYCMTCGQELSPEEVDKHEENRHFVVYADVLDNYIKVVKKTLLWVLDEETEEVEEEW